MTDPWYKLDKEGSLQHSRDFKTSHGEDYEEFHNYLNSNVPPQTSSERGPIFEQEQSRLIRGQTRRSALSIPLTDRYSYTDEASFDRTKQASSDAQVPLVYNAADVGRAGPSPYEDL